MATIGFLMLAEPGHLNGPMKLAKALEACGHRVCFLGMPGAEALIGREGLPFIPLLNAASGYQPAIGLIVRYLKHAMECGQTAHSSVEALLHRAIAAACTQREQPLAREALDGMMHSIRDAKVDLLFVDYFLPSIAWLTKWLDIKTALLNAALYDAPLGGDATEGRATAASVLALPVVYMCPREFDVAEAEPAGHPRYYIEPLVDLERAQARFEWHRLDAARPLLLCSFGSQHRVVSRAKRVIQAVIDAMAAKPRWQAVVSLGQSFVAEEFMSVPVNVVLARMVPQLDLLKQSAIMVTHGGLGSVKECIFFGVPMIVVPFDMDQPVNALRVVHHGLGLMRTPETVSAGELRSMIETIEQDDSFKRRSAVMQRRFREIEWSGVGVRTVMELLR